MYKKVVFRTDKEKEYTAQEQRLKTHEKIEEETVFLRCAENTLPLFTYIRIQYHFAEQGCIEPEY
jgi:hypothetical protein